MAIQKLGHINRISRSLSDLAVQQMAFLEALSDKALEKTIDSVLPEGSGEANVAEYAAFLIKHYAGIRFPKLAHVAEEKLEQLGMVLARLSKGGTAIFTFCNSQGLDPHQSQARLIDEKYTFANADLYYDRRGRLLEFYQGNLFSTKIEDRKYSVIYLPGRPDFRPRPSFGLSISNSK